MEDFIYISHNSFDNNSEGRKIYVPYSRLEEYLSNEIWQIYESDITVHETAISFDSQGGSACENGSVYYQDYLELPTPARNGYTFAGWYTNETCTGTALNEQTRWDSLSDTVTLYADWEPINYSIIYATKFYRDGRIIESTSGTYTIEESVIFYTPTKEGYTFVGWYNDYALTESAGNSFAAGNTGTKYLYAKWQANTYQVTYDLNDSTQFPARIGSTNGSVVYGTSSYQFAVPTKVGFTFNGWKVLVNGSYQFYTDSQGKANRVWDIANDVTVVADWTRHTYYVKVNSDGTIAWLSENGFTNTQTGIEYGSVFSDADDLVNIFKLEDASMKTGHIFRYFELSTGTKFVRWSQIANLYNDGDVIELTACFEKEKNFIIYFVDEKTGEFSSIQRDYDADITDGYLTTTAAGYSIVGWEVAPATAENDNADFVGTILAPGTAFSYTKMPDLSVGYEKHGGVIFVRSVIQANQYQVTYVNTYGQSSVSATMVTYDTTPQYASVTEVTGRAFVGWHTGSNGTGTKLSDADGEGICTWKYAQDKTVYAYWIAVPYEITYNLNGGSYASGVSNPTMYTIDTATITLKAPIRSGYSFKGWKNAVTGVIVSTIPKGSTGALSFIAQWTPLYTISFSANGGSSCSSITAEANAMIKLPTSTRAGYMGTWNGYAFGSTYTVTGNRTFTAVWTGNTYTITFNRNGGTSGTTSKTVKYGSVMPSITRPTRSGYRFECYKDSSGNKYYINGQNETKTYNVVGNLTLTAYWTESYLDISNQGKSGTNWSIKITNNSSTTVTVYYNKKMCYLSDAQNWTGLNDVASFTLTSGSSNTITISENWFATSITVSYVTSSGVRMITYANELNTNKTMNIMTNKIT